MERNIQVCIVDDDEKIGKMFKIILNELGMSADYMLNGHDAIEKVKSKDYDILFMDIIMPGMNGVQTLEKIRAINSDIPVIMISGYSAVELLEKAKEFGIHSSLSKPIYISQIVNTVQDIVSQKKKKSKDRKRCLVIDEQKITEDAMLSILEECGFFVTISANCKEVFEKKEYKEFDLIILNFDPDYMASAVAFRMIIENFPRDNIIIFIDTSNEKKFFEKASEYEDPRYIPRSASKDELLRVLKEIKIIRCE